MELPPSSMYGGTPPSTAAGAPTSGTASPTSVTAAAVDPRTALDQLSAVHHAAAHMSAVAAAAMHNNPYAAAAAAANNHSAAAAAAAAGGNHVMGSGQGPDVHKRDKDAIYGLVFLKVPRTDGPFIRQNRNCDGNIQVIEKSLMTPRVFTCR
jgi:hypothetical protein